MRDLDFDELDKAVKAVMSEGGISDTVSSPASASTPAPAARVSASSTSDTKVPLVGGSKDSFRPKKRSGLFMDMKSSTGGRSNAVSDPMMTNKDSSSPAPRPLKDNSASGFEFTKNEPTQDTSSQSRDTKEPFADAFASLKDEVKSFGIESESGDSINVNRRGPSLKPLAEKPVEKPAEQAPQEEPSLEEDASFSPFLSSVPVNKRPLGGYGGNSSSNESVVPSETLTNEESSSKRTADDFYGADPLADMTIEDIDATIVSPDGLSSKGDSRTDSSSEVSDITTGDMGARIEQELAGNSTDTTTEESSASKASVDSFHEEAPIFKEDEIIADVDASFAKDTATDSEEGEKDSTDVDPEPVPTPVPAQDVDSESNDHPPIEGIDKKISDLETEVEEVTEVAENEGSEDDIAKSEIGKMTVSPGDDSVSVEQVAAMEESIASQTEGPEEQVVKKKGLLKRAKSSVDKPVKEKSSKEDKPSILREGGPGYISPQYRKPANSLKSDKAEHSTFNPDSFAMPVGNAVKQSKGISPMVMTLVSLAAIIAGIAGAFGLFYSGLI